MGLSDPRTVYGVHSFTPFRRNSGLPFGTALVLGNSTFTLTGELTTLFGGSNRYAWDVQDATITAEINLALKQFENWMWEVFLGKAPTHTTADSATGEVTAIVNKLGTSVVAATGLASVGLKAGSTADVKFAKYIVKVISATTVDVFALSDIDFARGADLDFETDLLKITATPLTITMGGVVEIPETGLELTGGGGVILMVAGDTATFESFPAYDEKLEVSIGGTTDVFPEFSALMLAQQKGNGEMMEVTVHRAKALGLPMGLAEKAFAEPEVTAQAFYDATLNSVATFRWVKP